jgi:hemolysin D
MSSVASKSLVPTWQRAGRKDPTLPAILEFQWPSTAIINAPIPRSARGISWMVTGMVAALIVASALIPIDQVVTARGIVVSRSATILVQPLETAIVRSIDVHEGQRVRAGDVLARLDPTFASADLAALAATVTSLEAEVARLQAESAGKPFNYTENQPSWLLQAAIHAHRMAEFDSKIENYRHKADELASVTTRAESDATAYRERLNVAQTVEEMRKQLEVLQAGSKLQLLLAKDNRAEMARSLAYAEQTAEGAKRDKAAVESESNAYIQGWRAEVSQRLAVANEKWSDAREQLNKAKLRRQLVELRSDRDAIVQSVARFRSARLCNRASSSLLWCRPTRRSRLKPTSSATTAALCMLVMPRRSSSTPSLFPSMAWPRVK